MKLDYVLGVLRGRLRRFPYNPIKGEHDYISGVHDGLSMAIELVESISASQPLNSVDAEQQVGDAYDTDWCDEPTDQDYI